MQLILSIPKKKEILDLSTQQKILIPYIACKKQLDWTISKKSRSVSDATDELERGGQIQADMPCGSLDERLGSLLEGLHSVANAIAAQTVESKIQVVLFRPVPPTSSLGWHLEVCRFYPSFGKPPQAFFKTEPFFTPGQGVAGKVWETGQAEFIGNVHSQGCNSTFISFPGDQHIKSIACFPIIDAGGGVLDSPVEEQLQNQLPMTNVAAILSIDSNVEGLMGERRIWEPILEAFSIRILLELRFDAWKSLALIPRPEERKFTVPSTDASIPATN